VESKGKERIASFVMAPSPGLTRRTRSSLSPRKVCACFFNRLFCTTQVGFSSTLPPVLFNNEGGGGGKGTWGKPGSEINPTHYFIDSRDPNYPVEDGDTVFESFEPELSLQEVTKQVTQVILEYFENGDTDEV